MNFSVLNYTYPISSVFSSFKSTALSRLPYSPKQDSVAVDSELKKFLSPTAIQSMLESNKVISKLLNDNGVPVKADVNNFMKTTYKHSIDTRNKAVGIYNSLPVDLKLKANMEYIQKGALLHDIGKVFIPSNILNKEGRLNECETNVMHLHSRLSEEMLATQNIEPEVLNIVKYHHQNNNGSGYPEIKNTLRGFDINTEVVALADKYSALTEKRSYKNSMSSDEALAIIKKSVDNGDINPRVYNALVAYVNNNANKQSGAVVPAVA